MIFIYAISKHYQGAGTTAYSVANLQRAYWQESRTGKLVVEDLGKVPFGIQQGAVQVKQYSFIHNFFKTFLNKKEGLLWLAQIHQVVNINVIAQSIFFGNRVVSHTG